MVEQKVSSIDALKNDFHTLDSKITLIAQKLRSIEKNEEVIGRTIVVHNEKLRDMEASKGSSAVSGEVSALSSNLSEQVSKDLREMKDKLKTLEDELKEMRYVLDSINPLEFVKTDQIRDLVKEELGKK